MRRERREIMSDQKKLIFSGMKETTFHRFYQFKIPFNIIVNNCINSGPQYNHSMTQQSVDDKSNGILLMQT